LINRSIYVKVFRGRNFKNSNVSFKSNRPNLSINQTKTLLLIGLKAGGYSLYSPPIIEERQRRFNNNLYNYYAGEGYKIIDCLIKSKDFRYLTILTAIAALKLFLALKLLLTPEL
jgi:hypothetical protein